MTGAAMDPAAPLHPRVAHFVYRLGQYSGAADQALLLAKNVGVDAVVFNFSGGPFRRTRVHAAVEVVDLPARRRDWMPIVLGLVLRHRIRVFHLHGWFNEVLALGTILRRRIVVKTTLLGFDDLDSVSRSRWGAAKIRLMRHVWRNVVLSGRLRQINAAHVGRDRVVLMPNGVDVPARCPAPEAKERAICFVGLICERKRAREAIEAFADHYAHDPRAVMYVIGPFADDPQAADHSPGYAQSCRDLAAARGLEDRIVFTGKVSKARAIAYLRRSVALILLSDKEGMPNAVLEAMAANCAPIVSEMDGVAREMIEDGRDGFVLRTTADRWPSWDELGALVARGGPYRRACDGFDASVIAERYRAIYREAIGDAQAAGAGTPQVRG